MTRAPNAVRQPSADGALRLARALELHGIVEGDAVAAGAEPSADAESNSD